jgi:hypothetical protein
MLGLVADVERDFSIRPAHLPEELLFEFPAGCSIVAVTQAALESDEFPVQEPLLA